MCFYGGTWQNLQHAGRLSITRAPGVYDHESAFFSRPQDGVKNVSCLPSVYSWSISFSKETGLEMTISCPDNSSYHSCRETPVGGNFYRPFAKRRHSPETRRTNPRKQGAFPQKKVLSPTPLSCLSKGNLLFFHRWELLVTYKFDRTGRNRTKTIRKTKVRACSETSRSAAVRKGWVVVGGRKEGNRTRVFVGPELETGGKWGGKSTVGAAPAGTA